MARHRSFLFVSLAMSVAACGAPPPQSPEVASQVPTAAPPKKVEPPAAVACADKDTCTAEARQKHGSGDVLGARESFARACHFGDKSACGKAGSLFLESPVDRGQAASMFSHACADGTGDPDGCAALVAVHLDAKDTSPDQLEKDALGACKPGGADARAKKARADACMVVAQANETGPAPNEGRGVAALRTACELGHDGACKAQKKAEKPEKPSLLAGANLRVDGISGNGMVLDEVACKTEGLGGMFGAMTLVGTFAPRKSKLDACAKAKTEIVLTWTSKAGAMTDVKATGATPAVHACVERAMASAQVMPGTCAARFSLRR